LSANISHLNPDGGFGINKIHMIPQQVAKICDPRFLSVFVMIRMIAESPFSWNKEGLTSIRPIKVCYAMVLQPEINRARLFNKSPVEGYLDILEFLIVLFLQKGANHQLYNFRDCPLGSNNPKEIDLATFLRPSR